MDENKKVEHYHLTDEEQKQIAEKLEEENRKDFEKSVEEEKKNNPVSGLPQMRVESRTDPITGETITGQEVGESELDNLTEDEIMSKFGKSIAAANQQIVVTIDDLKNYFNDSLFGDISKISTATKQKLVDITNDSITNPNKSYTFTDLPEEIQNIIRGYFGKIAIPRDTTKVYNDTADDFVVQMKASASIARSRDEFNKQTNLLYNEAQDEILPLIQEYEENREKALREALKDIDDEKEKKDIEDSLDAMADAYSLKPLIEAAHRIKIKHFDLEKPERNYDSIHFKYKKDTRYNIYRLDTAVPQLSSHLLQNKLITDEDAKQNRSATIFMVAFAKYCANFKPQVIKEHTFMYYVLYNIYLLNVYHGVSYDKFAPKFLNNVMEVVKNCNCRV